ncbi:MAG TPA: hypothetical protein VNT28_00980 [Candidatus Limnocylindrales bacterium]|nr:hypothetical protein [Candidatus Limnocylindrales bacterium]
MSEQRPSTSLEAWRLVEQRLSARDPDATDFEDIALEAERLRAEYQGSSLSEAAMDERLDGPARESDLHRLIG